MKKARLYWHIFVTDKTPAIVSEQLRFIQCQPYPVTAVITGTDNDRTLLGLCAESNEDHGTMGADKKNDLIAEILGMFGDHKMIDQVKVAQARESDLDTLKFLYLESGDYEFVGYFHTGSAGNYYAHMQSWRNLMGFYTVQMAENSILCLEGGGYDFIGAMDDGGMAGGRPLIAGNCWWARSSYIRRLPFPSLSPGLSGHDDRASWIGMGNGKMGIFQESRILDTPLADIAEKYDTDKKEHGYIPFYELYLSRFRFRKGRLLEIGVYKGESLRLWQHALPGFVVEGVDIEAKPDIRAKVYVGDQADRDFLSKLPAYDIIIDDGGHRTWQQIISLVSKIQDTWLYVIEDLHTAYPDLYLNYHVPGEITCLDYLLRYPNLKPDYITQAEHERLAGKRIYFEHGKYSPIAFIL